MKQCTICKQDKHKSQFNKNCHKPDGLQTKCRDCSCRLSREYYHKNKSYHIRACSKIKKRRVKETQSYILQYLASHHCVDCGESDPRCLEFDHLKDKQHNVSRMIGLGYGIKTIQSEIDKCEVRCANCHRKKTAEEMHWFTATGTG